MKHVLFVCTGNTFRSASADYLLKHLLLEKHDSKFIVSSAGTKGNPLGVYPATKERVAKFGADMSRHQYRILNQEIIGEADIIVCMAKHHQEFIQKNFGAESYLFNELAYDTKTDLKDDDEAAGEYEDLDEFINETVDVIFEGMPELYRKIHEM
jgi:protein-tyrosine-phosphatase